MPTLLCTSPGSATSLRNVFIISASLFSVTFAKPTKSFNHAHSISPTQEATHQQSRESNPRRALFVIAFAKLRLNLSNAEGTTERDPIRLLLFSIVEVSCCKSHTQNATLEQVYLSYKTAPLPRDDCETTICACDDPTFGQILEEVLIC